MCQQHYSAPNQCVYNYSYQKPIFQEHKIQELGELVYKICFFFFFFPKFASFLDNSASKWCQKPEINTVKFHSENSHLKNEKKIFPNLRNIFLVFSLLDNSTLDWSQEVPSNPVILQTRKRKPIKK